MNIYIKGLSSSEDASVLHLRAVQKTAKLEKINAVISFENGKEFYVSKTLTGYSVRELT